MATGRISSAFRVPQQALAATVKSRRTLRIASMTSQVPESHREQSLHPRQVLSSRLVSSGASSSVSNRIHRNSKTFTAARFHSSQAIHDNDDDDDDNVDSLDTVGSNVVPFLLADIGEGIQEVEVLQWFVQVGDQVKEFDTICQVQSDKATVEITSRFAGTVVAISPDTTISVGQPLVHIETTAAGFATGSAGAAGSTPNNTSAATTPPPPTALEQQAHEEQSKEDAQGDARLHIPSVASHFLLDSDAADVAEEEDNKAKKYQASPAVRKLAADHDINLAAMQGTGPQGRILKADVLQFVKQQQQQGHEPPHAAPTHAPPLQAPGTAETAATRTNPKIVSMTGYNKFMVQSMTESLQIPHMGLGDEIIVDKLLQFRNDWNSSQPAENKLGMQTLLIKACSMALKDHPAVNAKTHDVEQCQVSQYDNHDIGVAMDTPHGLVVPIVRHVQDKSLMEIQQELDRLKQGAASGTTELKDLLPGPTFTLSNIGAVGVGTHMSPVVVPPMIAMGALGRIQRLPRFDEQDNVVPTNVLYASWVADHRFLDGATLARFHKSFAKYASDPLLMLPLLK